VTGRAGVMDLVVQGTDRDSACSASRVWMAGR
jgi:hypothetical protein